MKPSKLTTRIERNRTRNKEYENRTRTKPNTKGSFSSLALARVGSARLGGLRDQSCLGLVDNIHLRPSPLARSSAAAVTTQSVASPAPRGTGASTHPSRLTVVPSFNSPLCGRLVHLRREQGSGRRRSVPPDPLFETLCPSPVTTISCTDTFKRHLITFLSRHRTPN